MAANFDPFNDRRARDIRNSLSSALVLDLAVEKGTAVEKVAGDWKLQDLRPSERRYIRHTLERYQQVATQIKSAHIVDPKHQALVLWNAGLFFELHELLETIWRVAQGEARMGLKGLIQAAGVYVHQLRGNAAAAQGLARRAKRNLLAGRNQLAFATDLDRLIQCLDYPSQPPPRLTSVHPQVANLPDIGVARKI
jgi:uncharacterized protein